MGILSNLEPKEVFRYFEDISNIPRGSYREKAVSDYCVAFGKEHGLEVMQDELFNIIMKKPATPGYETVPPLILQGHLDMVCEKTPDCDIDMEKEGLRLKVTGDYVEAQGTTLGGDDGIAIAYALAVLASKDLKHPALEVIFTVSEEVGMEGASAIDLSGLAGKKLINIDSEEEGIFLTSCAGGARVQCRLLVGNEEAVGSAYEVRITGLRGGHSGCEIDKGGGNSNVLLGRILLFLEERMHYELVSAAGGTKDNAIPRDSAAVILVKKEQIPLLVELVQKTEEELQKEFHVQDPSLEIRLTPLSEGKRGVLVDESKEKIIMLLNALPNGVQTMSRYVPGLVETSLNLGILQTEEKYVTLTYAVRSSVESAKAALIQKMRFITSCAGGTVQISGEYPGWEYKEDSKLREDMVKIYTQMYGKAPKLEAIHAGLECGLISDKIPGIDCVSLGPDMKNVHTVEEQLSISSTKRVWEFLVQVLACK